MNFRFKLNPHLLFYFALMKGRKGKSQKEWTACQNRLWDEYQKGYKLLQGRTEMAFVGDYSCWFSEADKEMKSLIEIGMECQEFKSLLADTEEYMKWIEDKWEKGKEQVETELKSILRMELSSEEATVFVVDSSVGVGQYFGNRNIVWGHTEDWQNYSLVYLAHEYLHTFIPNGNVSHAVIELTTDNELRIRLNKEGEYFDIDTRDWLLGLEKKILPAWNVYLESGDNDILEFIREQTEQLG
jgi:hypothetical protein